MATITSSIGTSGRDYSTLQAWEDAIPANVVTSGNSYVGECYNDSEFTAACNMSGHTTDATHTIKLTTATGQSFRDNASVQTNPLNYDQSKGVGISLIGGFDIAITMTSAYTTVSNLQIKVDDNNYSLDNSGTAFNRLIEDCIIRNYYVAGVGIAGNSTTCKNCLFILIGPSQGGIIQAFNRSLFYNCTIVAPSNISVKPTYAINGSIGDPASTFINCAIFGATDLADNAGGTPTYLYCYSDNTTAFDPGITTVTYNNTQFVNTQSDWRIPTGSAMKNAVPVDKDIAGTTRPSSTSCDVGAWEFFVSSGGSGGGTKEIRFF